MHVEARMPLQPLIDPKVFMSGVIVSNNVDVEIGRALLVDQCEKGEPFLMTMARREVGDELAVEIIERGEQGQGAVPYVIMGLGADVANAQRQTRLRALERLALRFLIAAQHQGLLRRVQIRPITSQNFCSNRLSLDSLKVRERCGLMSLAAHSRCTLAAEIPTARAIVRQLQRPRSGGGVTARSSTCWAAPSASHGLRPRPGASRNPASRSLANRPTQRLTCRRDIPRRSAICCWVSPSALSRTSSERRRSRTETVLARARRRNSSASSGCNSMRGRAMIASPNDRQMISSHPRVCNLIYETPH